jgi:hypothetical protein
MIEKLFEINYIDPIIKKYTSRHLKRSEEKEYQCTKCRHSFKIDEILYIYYGGKQRHVCQECYIKLRDKI